MERRSFLKTLLAAGGAFLVASLAPAGAMAMPLAPANAPRTTAQGDFAPAEGEEARLEDARWAPRRRRRFWRRRRFARRRFR